MRGMAVNALESLSGSRARDARSTYSNPVSLPTQGADNAHETAEICHDRFIKVLDGLYFMIAQEERRIRQDPIARTTALLKKVLG